MDTSLKNNEKNVRLQRLFIRINTKEGQTIATTSVGEIKELKNYAFYVQWTSH